ncbi:MAG: sirohydrochlorin chelatase, partial [Coleofasciculaceae cyanobacterium]
TVLPLSSAYLLISHGSRDPRPSQGMDALAQLLRTKLETQGATLIPKQGAEQLLSKYQERIATPEVLVNSTRYPLVGTATLELAEIPLHEQVRQFASVALAAGCNQLELLPLFLLPGVHVMEDIPAEVAAAKTSLGDAMVINVRSHLGACPSLAKMLAQQLATINADAKILMTHGTRRAGGNAPIEAVAKDLGATVAYWLVKPSLEDQVNILASEGAKKIAILPYFLFSGGITDAISQEVTRLQNQFSQLDLSLCNPIGASSDLADLIINLIENS